MYSERNFHIRLFVYVNRFGRCHLCTWIKSLKRKTNCENISRRYTDVYMTERLYHKSEQRVILLSKYPFTIHVHLRDVHIFPSYLDNNFSCVKTCEEIVEIVLLVEKYMRKHLHSDMRLVHPPLDGSYEAEIPSRAFLRAKKRQQTPSDCVGWWVHQLSPSREPSLVLLTLRLAFSFTPLISTSRERTLM